MAYETIPINHFAMLTAQSWRHESVQQFVHRFNPWKDELLSRMLLTRFNVLRQIHLRDQDMRSMYWRRLDIEDQLLAEAEYHEYVRIYSLLFEAECEYVIEKYLPREIALLDAIIADPKLLVKFASLVKDGDELEVLRAKIFASSDDSVTPLEQSRRIIRGGLTIHLIPTSYLENIAYAQSLHLPNINPPATILPLPLTPIERAQVTRWRNTIAQVQVDIIASSDNLLRELALAGFKNSPLKKPYSDRHILLENQFVPHPTLSTFAAWFSICGIAYRGLQRNEQAAWTRLCGWPPTHILTYQLPALPTTKEHGGVGIGAGDDSQSDHSLPGRNSAHDRTEGGRIVQGLYVVRTVLLGSGDGTSHVVADSELRSAGDSAMSYHHSHLDMLPWAADTDELWRRGGVHNLDVFTHGLKLSESKHIKTMLYDPYLSTMTNPLSIHWPAERFALDIPFRSMSRFFGLHMRFSGSSEGRIHAATWTLSFDEVAQQYAAATREELNTAYFEAALETQNAEFGIAPVEKLSKGRQVRFDLSSLISDS